MAKPKMIETGEGSLSAPGKITTDAEGKITPASVQAVNSYLADIARTISGRLSLGNGTAYGRAGNLDAQVLEFTTPSSPDTEFTVFHSLERVPIGYLVTAQNKAGSLYTSQFASWSKTEAQFKCDVASVLMNIILY